MDMASNDVLVALNYLLPGLVATWAFRRLTPHDKPKDLEAIIEALLFTAAVQSAVILLESLFVWIGLNCCAIGIWNEKSALVTSVLFGLGLGLLSGVAANKDWAHSILRKYGLTKQTSFPSEWYRHLFCEERYVILTMRNGDRIQGWPSEFPNSPEKGHFSLRLAAWLPVDGDPLELKSAECILIPAAEVMYLEFLRTTEEMANEQEVSN